MGQLIIGNGNGSTTTNAGLTWTTSTNVLSATNLAVSGTGTMTGTSTLTGRVRIGKAPHTTYACDINGTINATSVLVNGSAVILERLILQVNYILLHQIIQQLQLIY